MPIKRPERSLEEPRTERTQEGAEVAFTEAIGTNTSIVKHILNTPLLKIKTFEVGEIAPCKVSVFWMDGITDLDMVKDVCQRIERLKIKWVPHSIVISDELNESGLAPFQAFRITERFDSFCAALMGGRVGVIVDNTPLGIVVPTLFLENFTATGEYETSTNRFLGRYIRLFTFLLGIYIPAIYLVIAKHYINYIPKNFRPIFYDGEILDTWMEIGILIMIVRIAADLVFRLNKNLLFIMSILFGGVMATLSEEKLLFDPYAVIIMTFALLASTGLTRRLGSAIIVFQYLLLFVGYFFAWKGIAITSALILVRIATGRAYGVPFLSPLFPPKFPEWRDTIFGRGKMKDIINREHKLKE